MHAHALHAGGDYFQQTYCHRLLVPALVISFRAQHCNEGGGKDLPAAFDAGVADPYSCTILPRMHAHAHDDLHRFTFPSARPSTRSSACIHKSIRTLWLVSSEQRVISIESARSIMVRMSTRHGLPASQDTIVPSAGEAIKIPSHNWSRSGARSIAIVVHGAMRHDGRSPRFAQECAGFKQSS